MCKKTVGSQLKHTYVFLTNLFGSIYIQTCKEKSEYLHSKNTDILKLDPKRQGTNRTLLKSSHARHLPESNYIIICTVIYTQYTYARSQTKHTQTGYTQTLKDRLLKNTFIFAVLYDRDSHAPRTKYRIVQHHILSVEVLNICV